MTEASEKFELVAAQHGRGCLYSEPELRKSVIESDVTITVSQEELSFLVQLFGVDTIPGLGENPFAFLSDESRELCMGIVQRSLLARAMLRERTAGIELNSFVASIVGICVRPGWVVTVATGDDDHSTLTVYSVTPYATVRHTLQPPFLHHLTLLPVFPDLPSQIKSMLEPLPQNSIVPSLLLSNTDLAALFRSPVSHNDDDGPDALWEESWRAQFRRDIEKPVRQVVLEVSDLRGEVPGSERVHWFVGSTQAWTLANHQDSTGCNQAQLAATTHEQLERTLSRMLGNIYDCYQAGSKTQS